MYGHNEPRPPHLAVNGKGIITYGPGDDKESQRHFLKKCPFSSPIFQFPTTEPAIPHPAKKGVVPL